MEIDRKPTKRILLGAVAIGGGSPVSIQSMTTTRPDDLRASVAQCRRLARAGCEIVRVAVPDEKAARALAPLAREMPLPLVADIHFDHRLALVALDQGAHGIRINPGNIGGRRRVAEIAKAAAARKAVIRVGVNSGSLEKTLLEKHEGPTPEALAESALGCVRRIEDAGHDLIKISVKASSVCDTIAAYRRVSEMTRYPLHLGVTEAGPPLTSAVRSSLGIGHLLLCGIGDTIRVSVTGDPVREVEIAKEMLQSLRLRQFGPTLVSCPTCGRCGIDLAKTVRQVQRALEGVKKPVTVAVMGCAVNGPGEAREADVGLAGGKGKGVIFRKGRIVRTVKEKEFARALLEEIRLL